MEVCNLKLKKEGKNHNKFLMNLAIIIMVAAITDTILSLGDLPNSVPTHFGFDGAFNGYISNKFFIFIYSVGSIIALGASSWFSSHPEKLSYRVNITEENCKREYLLGSKFTMILGIEAVIIFSLMQLMVTRAVLNGEGGINILFTGFSFVIVILTECIYQYKANKIK